MITGPISVLCEAGDARYLSRVGQCGRTPAEDPGFSAWEGDVLRETDSLLGEDGFELPVPRDSVRAEPVLTEIATWDDRLLAQQPKELSLGKRA